MFENVEKLKCIPEGAGISSLSLSFDPSDHRTIG